MLGIFSLTIFSGDPVIHDHIVVPLLVIISNPAPR